MQESIQREEAYWYVIDIFKKGYLVLGWKCRNPYKFLEQFISAEYILYGLLK